MTGQFGTLGVKPAAPEPPKPNRRLDSWKEIAAFFGRDERTVKRWEKERSLPVHRLPGGSRARVFAFTDELQTWMSSLDSQPAELAGGDSLSESLEAPASANTSTSHAPTAPDQAAHRERWFWILAACALLAVAAIIFWRDYTGRPATISPAVKASTHSVNPEAQDLYLKGRYYWDRRTPADLTKAVDLFTQSIVRDPNYAQPYVGLADCYNLLREFAAMPSDEAFPRALAAAKKAVELDDSSSAAHASLAFVTYYWSWDVAGAEAEFRRALELDPHYGAAHHWYATFLMSNGRYEESMHEFDAAQKLDPASTSIIADKALLLMVEGRPDEAEALLKQIAASQPGFVSTHRYLSYVYWAKRDYPNHLNEARLAAQLSHDDPELAIVDASQRGFRKGGERGLLESRFQAQKKFYAEGKLSPFALAETAALLGEKQEALRYLQLSYQRHDENFLRANRDYALGSLRNEAEFKKLLADSGLAPKT